MAVCEEGLATALAEDLDGHFECLVLMFQGRVFGFALRLTGNPQDAEEIAQDTFIRAYRALSTYDAERVGMMRLSPWLYQIALNLFRNRARRRSAPAVSVEHEREDAPIFEIVADPRQEPAAHAEDAEGERELARVIAALPAHLRVALLLRHVEGRTYDEIATILGQPVGTVKSHAHRGVRLLRTMLAEHARADQKCEVRP